MSGVLRDSLQGAQAGLRPVIRREPFGNARRQQHFDLAKLLDNTCLHCRSIGLIDLKYLASSRATAIALRHSLKRHRNKMSQVSFTSVRSGFERVQALEPDLQAAHDAQRDRPS